MAYTVGFLTCLSLTVVAMVMTLQSGLARRRSVHLKRALTTVALLVVTVVLAVLMSVYERVFPAAEMRIHRMFSVTVACAVPGVAVTGIVLWRRPRWRLAHRICVGILCLAALGAAVTGVWMLIQSTPRAA